MKDVDKAVKAYSAIFGATAPPIHTAGQLQLPKDYQGDPKAFVKTTELRTNSVEIHLLEPVGGISPWRDGLDKYGDGSLQHISFGVTDLPGTIEALRKVGGTLVSGGPTSIYAYMRFQQLPFIIELEKVPAQ